MLQQALVAEAKCRAEHTPNYLGAEYSSSLPSNDVVQYCITLGQPIVSGKSEPELHFHFHSRRRFGL